VPERGPGADVFGDRSDASTTWQGSPWGRLRYSIAHRTTARAVADLPGPLRVLDVGGGDGADSLPLAEGHQVTVLDFAPELLERAVQAAVAEGVADRVRTVCADLDGFLSNDHADALAPTAFDVVLCHNVLHYRADVPATVRLLVGRVRPGGVVSVMAPNPVMDYSPPLSAGWTRCARVRFSTRRPCMGRPSPRSRQPLPDLSTSNFRLVDAEPRRGCGQTLPGSTGRRRRVTHPHS
jgi:SAM-dependent methyltransferase